MRKGLWLTVVLALVVVGVVAIPALSQQGPLAGDEQPLPGAYAGVPGDMSGPPPAQRMSSATMVVADGVVYVACAGKLSAYEAKTLRKLGETTYLEATRGTQRGM
jgi:hypothetical protein